MMNGKTNYIDTETAECCETYSVYILVLFHLLDIYNIPSYLCTFFPELSKHEKKIGNLTILRQLMYGRFDISTLQRVINQVLAVCFYLVSICY